MKYFILAGVHNAPLPVTEEEFSQKLQEHQAFVKKGVEEGYILCGGPNLAGGGGFLIARAESREEMEKFLETDPFVIQKIQRYEFSEFLPDQHNPCLNEWVK